MLCSALERNTEVKLAKNLCMATVSGDAGAEPGPAEGTDGVFSLLRLVLLLPCQSGLPSCTHFVLCYF